MKNFLILLLLALPSLGYSEAADNPVSGCLTSSLNKLKKTQEKLAEEILATNDELKKEIIIREKLKLENLSSRVSKLKANMDALMELASTNESVKNQEAYLSLMDDLVEDLIVEDEQWSKSVKALRKYEIKVTAEPNIVKECLPQI